MSRNVKILLSVSLLFLSFSAPVEAAQAAGKPVFDKYGSLGPTAARVGDEVAIHGMNLWSTSEVTFEGGVQATSIREYAGTVGPNGSMVKDRIIVRVPQGARTGKLTVCNDSACAKTGDTLRIIEPLESETAIQLLAPNTLKIYKLGKKVAVKYRTVNWGKGKVFVYLNQYEPFSPKPNSGVLIGETTNKKSFTFTLATSGNGYFGIGENMFTIKVCNLWCEVSDESNQHFSIR